MISKLFVETVQNQPGIINSISSARATNPDQPIENAFDWVTYTTCNFSNTNEFFSVDFDLTTSYPINCLAVAGHNIPVGTRVSLLDGPGGTTLDNVDLNPATTGPALACWNQTYLLQTPRITFNTGQTSGFSLNVGQIFLGETLDLPMGLTAPFTRPPDGREAKQYPAIGSKGGQFLGTHVERVGWLFEIIQEHVDPAWMRANWLPLVRKLEQQPFFYSWDQMNYPEDAVYAWINGRIPPPRYSNPKFMTFSLPCRGLHVQ